MEQLPLFCFLLPILLTLYIAFKKKGHPNPNGGPPLPSPSKLPIIGSLHHLLRRSPHRRLHELALKHGPLMLVKLGQLDFLVVSSPEAAEEVLKAQELNFACRPRPTTAKFQSYNFTDIIFSPYGKCYRQLRKICVMELLNAKRVKSFSQMRGEEMLSLMKEISTNVEHPINLSKKLLSMTNTLIFKAVMGRKCRHQEKYFLAAWEQVNAIAGLNIVDLFPSLSFLDVVMGTKSKMKRLHEFVDGYLDEMIREHEEELTSKKNAEDEDFLDVLIKLRGSRDLEIPLTTDNIKGVIANLFLGGTETTPTTMEWAMAEMIRNPQVMEKAQIEVRQALQGRRELKESNVEGLKYLKLVIKETLRLHPAGTIFPRECSESCRVQGYTIPAGTRVLINAYALAKDPRYWEDADSFKPERFDGNPIDFKGTDFCFLPFGAGRRMCPGIGFGIVTVEFALANLLYYFDWKLPNGMKHDELDMSEHFSSVVTRNSELCLLAYPHIPLPVG